MPVEIPVRPAFWNVPLWGEVGVYVVGILAVLLCAWGIWEGVKRTRRTSAPNEGPAAPDRLGRMLHAVFFADRIRETPFGWLHAALVAGFFLLFLGTALATLDWDVGHYIAGSQFLTGKLYLAYKLVLDAAGVVVLGILLVGTVRRLRSPGRLTQSRRFYLAYAALAFVVLTGYAVEGLRLAAVNPPWIHFSPVGELFALLFAGIGLAGTEGHGLHVVFWTIHGLSALALIAATPLTFYGHLYRTPISIFSRKSAPLGRLEKIEAIEEQETFGLSRVAQLTLSERRQLEGCVECGRCNDVCPAVRAGTPLSPRTIVMKLRDRAEALARGTLDEEKDEKRLVGDIVTHEELFSCTTCGACLRACPAEIATPDLIVKMRRHLALESGEFPEGAAAALENTASVGNPWGLDPYERMDWAEGLDVPTAESGVHYDVLYWVGCAASYDRRARKIARAMVKILKAARVNFAVMAEERCHAEFARRLGEEYLYQTAAQENIENFAQYDFDRILVACPHCLNTLKNEYPAFEGMKAVPVVDHASFIAELLSKNAIEGFSGKDEALTVYHDPCYLARVNGITEAPREVLNTLARTVSPCEAGEKTFCCGAGGGLIWSESRPEKPVQVIRLHALRETGAGRIAVACPHCLTMLESARSLEKDADAVVLEDIAEIVARHIA